MRGSVNFDDILRNAYVDTYFQPIIRLSDANVIGYEALSRGPRGTGFFMPIALIAEAKSRNRMGELDHLLRRMALINVAKHSLLKPVFINIDPVAIYDAKKSESIVRRCREYGIEPHRIVLEVSEQNAVCATDRFQKMLANYRREGFLVACDDISCTLSNYNAVSGLSPRFIKISGRFVRGIDQSTDVNKISQLGSVISIAKMIDATVIAVGVETPQELDRLYHLGVDAAQGNLLAEPKKEITGIGQKSLELLSELSGAPVR